MSQLQTAPEQLLVPVRHPDGPGTVAPPGPLPHPDAVGAPAAAPGGVGGDPSAAAPPAGDDGRRTEVASGSPAVEPALSESLAARYSATFVARVALTLVVAVAAGLLLQLLVVSGQEYRSSQSAAFNQFRTELALGTAPLGPTRGRSLLSLGTPMAMLQIPAIGVRAVVGEGTTSSVLMQGPGHLRSSVFPGGEGTSVIFGRRTIYGGVFGHLADLRRGDRILVTTQAGHSVFRVVDVRQAGRHYPGVRPGQSRLTLATATGSPGIPSGVQWVDADKVGKPLPAAAPVLSAVLPSEKTLGIDTSTAWALVLWLEALTVLVVGAVWTWRRRGRAQGWVLFAAPIALVAVLAADQFVRMLPNLT